MHSFQWILLASGFCLAGGLFFLGLFEHADTPQPVRISELAALPAHSKAVFFGHITLFQSFREWDRLQVSDGNQAWIRAEKKFSREWNQHDWFEFTVHVTEEQSKKIFQLEHVKSLD